MLATHLVPFGVRKFHLVVLPLRGKKKGKHIELQMVTRSEAVQLGKTGLAGWLRKAEKLWEERKKETTTFSLDERLDYQGLLTGQQINAPYVLVYNASGKDLAACVIHTRRLKEVHKLPIQGFVVDHKLYRLEGTPRADEAHYLCAVLNSSPVNEAIKPHQTAGHFGERDIHRRPFEILAIPEFDPNSTLHKELARLSRACHRKVAKIGLDPERRIDLARREVQEALASELQKIDELVEQLLSSGAGIRKKRSNPHSLFEE